METWKVDLFNFNQVKEKILTRIKTAPNKFEYLVLFSETGVEKSFLDIDEKDYNRKMELKKSICFIAQAVAKRMVESETHGEMVNVEKKNETLTMESSDSHSTIRRELSERNIQYNTVFMKEEEEDTIESVMNSFGTLNTDLN